MPYKECTKCGNSKYEDDSNPNIHYQEPENNFICHSCRQYESLKKESGTKMLMESIIKNEANEKVN